MLLAHQDFKTSGLQDFRTSGYQDFRTSGHQNIRTSGHQDFRTSGHQDFRTSEICLYMLTLQCILIRTSGLQDIKNSFIDVNSIECTFRFRYLNINEILCEASWTSHLANCDRCGLTTRKFPGKMQFSCRKFPGT